jgi:hypothetical protein
MSDTKPTGLALLRQPFPAHHISKLPKPTKAQTDAVKADFKKGIRCKLCGAWHHPDVVHLDYVGHAALTDRLLDCDMSWTWEPAGIGPDGSPVYDKSGGMWIKLTVCGVTRYGYGSADGKTGGDAVKEIIGDALRNAAMRFGAALDLWHKGDLHAIEADDVVQQEPAQPVRRQAPAAPPPSETISEDQFVALRDKAEQAGVPEDAICAKAGVESLHMLPVSKFDATMKKLQVTIDAKKPADDLAGDGIPDFDKDTTK